MSRVRCGPVPIHAPTPSCRANKGLLPAAEVLSGLDGLVKAIREATPQALHHFTQADQVNQLVSASEADPDLGFMARMLVLCSLPRTNPSNRLQYAKLVLQPSIRASLSHPLILAFPMLYPTI